jgi:hypothetical protein
MKKLLLTIMVSFSFASDAEIIEEIYKCITPTQTLLVTTSHNAQDGRAIWINDWDLPYNEDLSYFLPIHSKNALNSKKKIEIFISIVFTKASCEKIFLEEALAKTIK